MGVFGGTVRPYGERAKRRPPGVSSSLWWVFILRRTKQARRSGDWYEPNDVADYSKQRNYARAEGKRAAREGLTEFAAPEDEVPGEDVFRCSPTCEFCNTPETAEEVFEAMSGMRRAATLAVIGWALS